MGLVPLGWSRDGKFAYVLEEETEAADCNSFEVLVQELRDGRTLWHGGYGSRGENPDGTRPLDDHVEVQQPSEGPECEGQVRKVWGKYRQKWFGAWASLGPRRISALWQSQLPFRLSHHALLHLIGLAFFSRTHVRAHVLGQSAAPPALEGRMASRLHPE